MRLHALLLVVSSVSFSQTLQLDFAGTAINTTNPDSPLAAPIQMTVVNEGCTLTISPPLFGSGSCSIKSFDQKSGRIEIVSYGAPGITWSGTVKGNLASGSYKTVGGETGSFYFAILKQPAKDAAILPQRAPGPTVIQPRNSNCVPAVESAIDGEIEGWDGETIFKLDNGQIWQQAVYDYTYFYAFHPAVTIYQTREGCRMKVEDESDTVVVKRIK